MTKKYWRIGLIVLVIGLLAFGGALVGLAGYPDPCDGPLPEPITGDDLDDLIQTSQENPAFPDPNPAKLDSPDDCDLVYFKVTDEEGEDIGPDDIGPDGNTFYGPEGFVVTIYKGIDEFGDTVFAFESNFAVMHVYAKGGPQEGNLYSYYPNYDDNDFRSDCGLKQSDQGGWSHIAFYYCVPQFGCLEVSKTWDDLETGATYDGSITVNIYDADNVLVGTLTLDEDNDWTDGLCELLPGTYTFSEVTPDGWTPSYNPPNRELVVEAGDEPVQGAIGTIENTPDLGCLKIVKDWVPFPEGFNELFPGYVPPPSIEVVVSGPYDYEETWTLTEADGWEETECDLPVGIYSIEEVTVPGYSATYDPVSMEVTVEKDATVTITITNEPDLGCLEVVKVWNYPEGFSDLFPGYVYETSIDVRVTGPAGYDEIWTLDGPGWAKTECGLLEGEYTVEELTVPGYSVSYNPSDRKATVQVGEGAETVTITITNEPDLGCLKITKQWQDNTFAYLPMPDFIEVQITGPFGYDQTFELNEGNGWTKTICDLVPGSYTAEELGDLDDWLVTYVPADRTVVVVEGDAEAAVEILIINYYELCDETAWAYGGQYANENWDFVDNMFWGWTNGPLGEGSYEFDIYAGAGQNEIWRGELVGTLYVDYEDGCVTVTYEMDEGFFLAEVHLWVGYDVLPEQTRGRTTVYTNAPGLFPYKGEFWESDPFKTEWTWSDCDFEGEIYVAAHSVVRFPCEPAE